MILGRQGDDRARCFGHPIGMVEAAAEYFDGALEHGLADRSCAIQDALKASQVHPGNARQIKQHLDHCRHEEAMRNPVVAHGCDDFSRHNLLHQNRVTTLAQAGHRIADPANMKQRHGDQIDA